jgi:glc operon protein GlcG
MLYRRKIFLNCHEEEVSMSNRFQIAWFAALAAFASPADAATDALIVQVPQISSAAAQQLGEACVEFAAKANTATAVAVVDPAGRLLYFFARQGASPTAPKTAELKAVTAARWGRATSQLMDQVKKGNAESLWLGDFPQAGGLPIIQDGHTLGAIGVAGPGGNDEKCAKEAIQAVFGNSVQTGRPVGAGAAARDGQSGTAP